MSTGAFQHPRGRQPDPAASFAPLDTGELDARGESVVGIAPLETGIVVAAMAVQNLSAEGAVAGERPEAYALMHEFGTDLTPGPVSWLALTDSAHARPGYASLEFEGDALILNTFARTNPFIGDSESVLAQRVAIKPGGPVLLGPAPAPTPAVYAHERSYPLDNGTLRLASEFVMERVDESGRREWALNIGAHLYTSIEMRDGLAWFGTAGNGGAFHCVDLRTGIERFRVPTGGTVEYNRWGEDRCVLFDHRRTQALVVLDAHHGTELARVSLGRYTVREDSPRLLLGNLFFATAFAPDRSQLLFRVDLDAVLHRSTSSGDIRD